MKDYKKLKLKAGLEIHQQLDTHKLFCTCPSILRSKDEKPKFTVQRKLNPVVGETGEIDKAALYEKSKEKTFTYEVYDTNCLVELDEEPPHEINKEALEISLKIALLLNCKIFPVTQVMRKTVIDGSNTTGFQRTVLIGHDGYVETSEGKVGIETIALEEDSARPSNSANEDEDETTDESKSDIKFATHNQKCVAAKGGRAGAFAKAKQENSKTYSLDRLGIPLVEITTKPEMYTPEQIKETALKIGEILRAAKVKRGIGTIRQDVNVSTKDHPRIEIKGFQDPKMMIKTIDNEIDRQQNETKEKYSHVRKALSDGKTKFLRPMPGAARMYPETDVPLLKISRQIINNAKNNLPKLASENKSFLKEYGLNEELIKSILKEKKVEEFKELIEYTNNYQLVAKMITIFMKEIQAKSNKTNQEIDNLLNSDILQEILKMLEENKISENDVKRIMQKIAEGQALKEATKKADINLEEEIENLIKEKPGLSQGAYMGLIMGKFKGQVTGAEVAKELGKQLK